MRLVLPLLAVAIAVTPSVVLRADEATAASQVDYVRDIKPLLEARCYACHGPLKQEQGLRLDTAALIRQGGDSGPAVEAHAPETSLLLTAVTGSDGWRMPLEGEPLTADEIAKIRTWIEAGAQGPADESPAPDPANHWAFQAPRRPELPAVSVGAAIRNPIDLFLAAEQAKQGIEPLGEADRETLLRRVYIDLIGLPPTAEQRAAFLADESPDAYEKVVERLLASPQHGERWARHWMDIWRYSDWYGYAAEVRNSQPHIWRWRDWIVQSLNSDHGYDRMIVEMLAADEVAPTDPQALAATGYLARNWYKFNRNTWLQDAVEHTGKAFLGLTFNCARCHDHKYDPISQEDYYEFRAFFETHDVRTDAVEGELDRGKQGLARAYDAHLDRPTHLFVRGDEKEPDTSRALAPGLPSILTPSPLAIAAIRLPKAAWYPSLDRAIREKALAAAIAKVNEAQVALAAPREKLAAAKQKLEQLAQAQPVAAAGAGTTAGEAQPAAEATPPVDSTAAQGDVTLAELEARVADKGAAAASAQLLAVQAKITADDAKFAEPANPAAGALALAAGHAERQAALVAAEHAKLVAESQLAIAKQSEKPDDENSKKAVTTAQTKLDETAKALTAAQTAASEGAPPYTPFDKTYPETSSGRRAALARWIASRQNPLAARVAVNHVWLRHFGRALAPTVFDFGMNGRRPSHPELLDWLAVEFMEHGWSFKHLHRQIVTSAAYRRASAGDAPRAAEIDPDNRLLWRANARRMDAEVVRDSLLHLAGKLDATLGGPELDQATADATNRRSIYYRHANEKRVTFLELFDQPGVSEAYQRIDSIVPQQALALLNSPPAIEHSRAIAEKLWTTSSEKEASSPEAAFVALSFAQVLGREPKPAEAENCLEFLSQESDEAARARLRGNLVHVLFNHNDFVAIR